MSSVNKAIIIGNLGKDPEYQQTTNGKKVTKFSIATTEKFTDRSGQKQEKTEWHNIVVWGKLAEIARQYLKKGSKVYIEGKITTRSWDDQATGQKRYATEIVGSHMQMLSSMQQSGQYQQQQVPMQQQGFAPQQPAPQQQQMSMPQQGVSPQQVQQQFNTSPIPDDDLPF